MKPQNIDLPELAAGRPDARVVVVGAGISGLTAAFILTRHYGQQGRAPQVVLLESDDRVGGLVKTFAQSGAIMECGPEAFLTSKTAVLDLCRQLEITDRLISTNNQQRNTFVGLNQKLHPLPEGFVLLAPTLIMPLLKSKLFTVSGKLRMAMDLLIPPRRCREDESLSDFVRRRFGKEVLERVAQPMIAGIHSAPAELLSAQHALPQFVDFEQRYGSVIAGLVRQMGGNGFKLGKREQTPSGARYSMFASFDRGMSVLTDKLAQQLPPGCLRTHSAVEAVRAGNQDRNWDVVLKTGDVISADAVILAVPAAAAAMILRPLDPELAKSLDEIPMGSSIVINHLCRRDDIAHRLNGFGLVLPRGEARSIIACTFSNVKFPNRAPADMVLLRSFMNVSVNPHLQDLGDRNLIDLAVRDLEVYIQLKAKPVFSLVTRHKHAIPQYRLGHRQRVDKIAALLENNPGIYLAGNAYNGAGIPDCITSGKQTAMAAINLLTCKMASSAAAAQTKKFTHIS